MASVFTRIIDGELPGTFVWRDERCVGLMSINPLCPGHVLVIPREEVAHWVDLDPEFLAHLTAVSQSIARAIDHAYEPERVGAMYAGLEVAHVHHHLVPIEELHDLDFANQSQDTSREELEAEASKIRDALAELGLAEVPATGGGASPG